jgi:hypothetical protein
MQNFMDFLLFPFFFFLAANIGDRLSACLVMTNVFTDCHNQISFSFTNLKINVFSLDTEILIERQFFFLESSLKGQ